MIEVVLNIYIRENVELNVLHLLSVVLRKPLNEDIVLSDPRYRVETHYAILRSVEISQVSLNKNRHNVSRIIPQCPDAHPYQWANIGCKYKDFSGNIQIFT